MELHHLTVGPLASSCYVLSNEPGRALVVDPGAEPESIVDVLRQHGLTVAAYALTHGHADHVGALTAVLREHPAPVGMHPADRALAFSRSGRNASASTGTGLLDELDRPLAAGQTWTDAGVTYRVLHTPGHTPGSVSFHCPEAGLLFSGDTLFSGSVGRTDLPGGDGRALAQSLGELARLPAATVVYPGHGPRTTIEQEKRTNYFLQGL
jgi:glyoxylase-like metal-dependent hydrolase (beta-lactamase superfamily II)